jgi:ketosteroid isomerase-like protein
VIPAQWKARVESADFKMVVTPLEVEIAGNWAYKRNVYTQEITDKKTGKKTVVDAKNLAIFKRQPDGSWKIYRDCFNSNLPVGQ